MQILVVLNDFRFWLGQQKNQNLFEILALFLLVRSDHSTSWLIIEPPEHSLPVVAASPV